MGQYTVTIPIAGHVVVTVEAKDTGNAINKAIEIASLDDIENWELLKSFNSGNVCCCPSPWTIEVEEDFV